MASISNDANGTKRVLFTDANGGRKAIRLGRITAKRADEIRGRVETLLSCLVTHTAIDTDTSRWIESIGPSLRKKLATAGLISPRHTSAATLTTYLGLYRKQRVDVSRGTSMNYGIVANRLLAFFSGSISLRHISESDADRWLVWLKTEYAGPTVSKSVKVARQFWAQAIRDGVAEANPFSHLRTPSEVNTARAFFVDRATFAKVIEACPDNQWRVLLVLARFGGLRTPSEPLSLELSDINWERQRFRVVAPKTKHDDGGERWVPLFPELRPYLEEAFDQAIDGAVHVITRYRDSNANLRTQLTRIIRRAGVKTWPRLFQNLRASRETELAETFPIHVVAEWLGNSPKTALAHYTQVTEDHFRQAAQIAAQYPAELSRIEPNPKVGRIPEAGMATALASPCDNKRKHLVTPTGFEPVSRP